MSLLLLSPAAAAPVRFTLRAAVIDLFPVSCFLNYLHVQEVIDFSRSFPNVLL